MSNPNVWTAAFVIVGGLCVSVAVVKHMHTPPPSMPPLVAAPSATGDRDSSDARAWNALTDVIDAEHCNQDRLEKLGDETRWYQALDHRNSLEQIEASVAAIAEYRQLGVDILAEEQKGTKRGALVIGHMQENVQSKTMKTFLDVEHALIANETDLQSAHKAELDTVSRLLDVAEDIQRRGGKSNADDAARWNRLVETLKQEHVAYVNKEYGMIQESSIRYTQLDRLVGRNRMYSYSRPGYAVWECNVEAMHASDVADVERQAQKILAQ